MIDLTLGAALQRGDIVTVNYAQGAAMAADGALLGAFAAQPVTNTIPVVIVTNLPGTWQIFDNVGNWQEDPFPTGDDPRGNVFNRHIVVIGNAVYFYGNGVHPFKDFLYLPSSEAAAKSFTINLDLCGIKYHSMEGGGFLFNTKIDGGLLSGYCALFTITGRVNNIDTYAVILYKIDGVDVATFHYSHECGTVDKWNNMDPFHIDNRADYCCFHNCHSKRVGWISDLLFQTRHYRRQVCWLFKNGYRRI